MLVDTHCHLDFDRYDEDRDETIERALDSSVTHIIIPAVDLEKIPAMLALADRYEGVIYTAVGIHPNSTADLPEDWLYQLENFADHPSVVAIGEIGLDYYWDRVPHPIQHRAFAEQLELALLLLGILTMLLGLQLFGLVLLLLVDKLMSQAESHIR